VCGAAGDRRTEADCVRFLENLFASTAPATTWHVIYDNLVGGLDSDDCLNAGHCVDRDGLHA
jgi:hypothetical protein